MRTFRKVTTDPRLVLRVDVPWQYSLGEKYPDNYVQATLRLERELDEAVKVCSNLGKIVARAVEDEDDCVLDVDVSHYEADTETDVVYLLEDDTKPKARGYRSQHTQEDLISALEWAMEESMPYREPIYNVNFTEKCGKVVHRKFDMFSELVERFYESDYTEYSCLDLTRDEDDFLKKVLEYKVMLKLRGKQ